MDRRSGSWRAPSPASGGRVGEGQARAWGAEGRTASSFRPSRSSEGRPPPCPPPQAGEGSRRLLPPQLRRGGKGASGAVRPSWVRTKVQISRGVRADHQHKLRGSPSQPSRRSQRRLLPPQAGEGSGRLRSPQLRRGAKGPSGAVRPSWVRTKVQINRGAPRRPSAQAARIAAPALPTLAEKPPPPQAGEGSRRLRSPQLRRGGKGASGAVRPSWVRTKVQISRGVRAAAPISTSCEVRRGPPVAAR